MTIKEPRRSLLLPVPLPPLTDSSSLSPTNESLIVRTPPPPSPQPFLPYLPMPRPNPSETSWTEISLLANCSSPVHSARGSTSLEGEEGRRLVKEPVELIQRWCEETKAGLRPVLLRAETAQRHTATQGR